VKQNRLDELPIARLSEAQLQHLKQAEQQINQQGNGVYLIAFEKQAPSR
jgi:penicillin-binding protein-related factor A (putative recombinase)